MYSFDVANKTGTFITNICNTKLNFCALFIPPKNIILIIHTFSFTNNLQIWSRTVPTFTQLPITITEILRKNKVIITIKSSYSKVIHCVRRIIKCNCYTIVIEIYILKNCCLQHLKTLNHQIFYIYIYKAHCIKFYFNYINILLHFLIKCPHILTTM